MYQPGECVLLTDVPIPVRCRVIDAETFTAGTRQAQLLKLAPLEGPWPFDTTLIRPDHAVKPATFPGNGRYRAGRSSVAPGRRPGRVTLPTVERRRGPWIRKSIDPAT